MGKYVFGVDVGGTSIKFGLFQVTGELVEKFSIDTNAKEGGRHLLPDVSQAILNKLVGHGLTLDDVKGVGVGVPSPVTDAGVALIGPNINWKEPVPVKEILMNLLQLPVYVANDANLAALGELWLGAAKGKTSVVLLTLGTGVGGGIVVDGKIVNGAGGAGGEVGHLVTVTKDGALCGCGKFGCLETVASATGIIRLAKAQLSNFKGESVLKRVDHMQAKDVFDGAIADDAFCLELVNQVGDYLGMTCANLAVTINPEVFILGGGVSQAGDVLLDAVSTHYEAYAFSSVKGTPFNLATLGNDAGMVGGAYLAMCGE